MEPWEREIIRRSTVMLSQGQQMPIRREDLLDLIEELQRLEERDRQAQALVAQLKAVLSTFDLS